MTNYRRGLWIGIGIFLFFWIGYEDRNLVLPVLIGGLIALALALELGPRYRKVDVENPSAGRWEAILIGLLAGTLAMPIAALSMLVKLSLHAHVPADFSLGQVLSVLGRTPIWAGVGGLAGLAAALSRRVRYES